MRNVLTYLILCLQFLFGQQTALKYLDPDLPVDQRVNDLIAHMTLDEKVSQMMDVAKAIPRLQIPEYNWWNEALHGVGRAGIATVFPQAIALAASWNTDLMFSVADVISTEARAKHHEALRNDDHSRYRGLTYWSPNINIFRDPRWGRGQETYGEDPFLTSRMAVQFVKGLQGDDEKYLKLVATPKHFAVHSGPEPDRHHFDAIIDNRDLYSTYLPAFEATIKEAHAQSIMCAYNRYMGSACCGSSFLLQDILRNKWGFNGYVVSDCWAIVDIYENHKITETAAEAAALAVASGTDLNCGSVFDPNLAEAVEQGLITEQHIDQALKRLFTARIRLGMFDPPERVKYAQIPFSENDSEEHRALSVKAARESVVLLKNAKKILPLNKNLKRIAVIGPTADSYDMLLGNYNGTPSRYVTPLQGIINKVGAGTEVLFEQGCDLVDEEGIVNDFSSGMVTHNGKEGLQAEYFKNTSLQGEPFFTRHDELQAKNWIWGARVEGIGRGDKFSIRWSGKLTAPETGTLNFIVKGKDGYRLFINDTLLLQDWAKHEEASERANHILVKEGKSYDFRLEYFRDSGWPHLSVKWEMLNKDYFQEAIDLAKRSDVVIFMGGITAQLEGEEMPVTFDGFKGGDRTDLKLPKVQTDLLKSIHSTGKPVVLVLSSGSALTVNWADENVPAIVQLWYPGQEGGTALADVLFGDYNPAGRLPVTFYRSVDQLPDFSDYAMANRTYRYFKDQPLYPFGYGLSYTQFTYHNLNMPDQIEAGQEIKVSVQVKNTGEKEGDEVVQLYIKDVKASVPVAIHSLQGFKRIHLKAAETKDVEFILQPRQLALVNDNARYVVEPGEFIISVGGRQPAADAEIQNVVSKKINITGQEFIAD